MLLLAGCGGSKQPAAVDVGIGVDSPPSLDELKAVLDAEFARLGVDPEKAVAVAPAGQANAVFDLSAKVIDPDGEGGEPPTGIELEWTEQLQGDYDQNGLVNYSDLTPISQQWNEVVSYDDAALHGGFQWWPTGDPDDAEGGSPLAEGTGALNWRRARVDGQRDGLITVNEITPIGQHWLERLSGYRVYVKGPGDAGFSLHDAATTTRDNFVPVRYSYTLPVDASGLHGIYVAAYDDESGTEGPASAAVYVDVDTGSVNHGPVASLSVTPGFAGAPAEITLDATASYDVDGTVAAYHWDFDGDGIVDWVSTEPVPEQSSGGTVELITPGAEGVVTATYTQGSAEWLYPSVVAVDDQDAQSAAASAKLGISGWETELLADPVNANINFYPEAVSHDPFTGQICLAGYVMSGTTPPWAGESVKGVYWARRTGAEQWDIELAQDFTDPDILGDWDSVSWISPIRMLWDGNGNPILTVGYYKQFPWLHKYKTIIIRRNDEGTWELDALLVDYVTGDAAIAQSGAFHFKLCYYTSNSDFQYYLGEYSGGDVHITDTGYYNDPDESQILHVFCLDDDDQVHFGIRDPDRTDWHSLYILDPVAENEWTPRKLLTIEDGDYSSLGWKKLLCEADRIVCLCTAYSKTDPVFGSAYGLYLAVTDGESTNAVCIRENVDSSKCRLFPLHDGYAVFAPEDSYQEETDQFSIYYYHLSDELQTGLAEEITYLDRSDHETDSKIVLNSAHCTVDGCGAAVHVLSGADYGEGAYGMFLSIRVDPRT